MVKIKIVDFFNYSLQNDYKFYFDHFLIKCTIFVLIVINTIENIKNSIFLPQSEREAGHPLGRRFFR